jgi:hypothetical protein
MERDINTTSSANRRIYKENYRYWKIWGEVLPN